MMNSSIQIFQNVLQQTVTGATGEAGVHAQSPAALEPTPEAGEYESDWVRACMFMRSVWVAKTQNKSYDRLFNCEKTKRNCVICVCAGSAR